MQNLEKEKNYILKHISKVIKNIFKNLLNVNEVNNITSTSLSIFANFL